MSESYDDLGSQERAARAEALTIAGDVLAGRGARLLREPLVGHVEDLITLARYITDGAPSNPGEDPNPEIELFVDLDGGAWWRVGPDDYRQQRTTGARKWSRVEIETQYGQLTPAVGGVA